MMNKTKGDYIMKTIAQLQNIKLRTTPAQKNKVTKIVMIAMEHNEEIEILSNGYRFVQSTFQEDGEKYGVNFDQSKKLPLAERALLVKLCKTFEVSLHEELIEA
jgi:hypothetical protein